MPTQQEFIRLLQTRDIEQVVREFVLEGETYIFRASPPAYRSFKERLAGSLGCRAENIRIVGSGKFGFSLAPHKYGQVFSPRSDIDVVVVDETMFDGAWIELVRAGPTTRALSAVLRGHFDEHRRNNVFWGFIEPGKLMGLTTCYRFWFPAFQNIGSMSQIFGRVVKGRLYRTWEHAVQYHVSGAREILALSS